MNEFDDLDELERELGPSLRVALRSAAARITDDAAPLLAASEDESPQGIVFDMESSRRARTGRRRRVVAAAAAAVGLVVAGTVLVTRTGDDDKIRTNVPAGPGPSSATMPTPSTTILTPPSTAPGDGSTDRPLLPEGAPSTPHAGELIAHAAAIHFRSIFLYADGRLISIDGNDSTWVEQRLTPEGVERVRSEILSSGWFDAAQPPGDVPPCGDIFGACVRDGDRFLNLADRDSRVGQVLNYLGTLGQTLPPTEWADRQFKTYVPSRIAVCLRMYDNQTEAPLNLSVLLSRFPPRAAQLLGGREPRAELVASLNSTRGLGLLDGSCFDMTLEEARALKDAFLDPAFGGSHEYWGIVVRFTQQSDPTQPDAAYILFQELLPDGTPALFPG